MYRKSRIYQLQDTRYYNKYWCLIYEFFPNLVLKYCYFIHCYFNMYRKPKKQLKNLSNHYNNYYFQDSSQNHLHKKDQQNIIPSVKNHNKLTKKGISLTKSPRKKFQQFYNDNDFLIDENTHSQNIQIVPITIIRNIENNFFINQMPAKQIYSNTQTKYPQYIHTPQQNIKKPFTPINMKSTTTTMQTISRSINQFNKLHRSNSNPIILCERKNYFDIQKKEKLIKITNIHKPQTAPPQELYFDRQKVNNIKLMKQRPSSVRSMSQEKPIKLKNFDEIPLKHSLIVDDMYMKNLRLSKAYR